MEVLIEVYRKTNFNLTVSPLDAVKDPQVITGGWYQVFDHETGLPMIERASLPTGSTTATLTMTAAINDFKDESNDQEIREVSVYAEYAGGAVPGVYKYAVLNVHGMAAT